MKKTIFVKQYSSKIHFILDLSNQLSSSLVITIIPENELLNLDRPTCSLPHLQFLTIRARIRFFTPAQNALNHEDWRGNGSQQEIRRRRLGGREPAWNQKGSITGTILNMKFVPNKLKPLCRSSPGF